jgi:chorismate mutase
MSNATGTPPAVPPEQAGATAGAAGTITVDGKTFTQDEYNRHIAERAERAKRAEREALEAEAKEAGFASVADMKAAALRAAQADKDKLSELEKLQADLAKAKSDAEVAKSEKADVLKAARLQALRAAVMLEANTQNVDPAELRSVWNEIKDDSVAAAKITDGDNGDFVGIHDVVAEVVKAHPRWLKEPAGNALGTPTPRAARLQPAANAPSEQEAKDKLRSTGSYAPI